MIEIKNGTIDDFFDSALETAKQIDNNVEITPKKSVWINLDKPENLEKSTFSNIFKTPIVVDEIKKYTREELHER